MVGLRINVLCYFAACISLQNSTAQKIFVQTLGELRTSIMTCPNSTKAACVYSGDNMSSSVAQRLRWTLRDSSRQFFRKASASAHHFMPLSQRYRNGING